MSSELFDLQGKVALVTGANGGLGAVICRVLAAQGALVLVCDCDIDACQRMANELGQDAGRAQALLGNLADISSISALAQSALAWKGRVDILVCNAGIQGPANSLSNVGDLDWQQVMDINLRSSVELTRHLLPPMALNGGGSVILMSSIAGLRGNKAIGLYGLSKAALAQLARNLAVEWGPQAIRINAVSPGLIRTPLAQPLLENDDFMSRRLSLTPLRRVGEPEEVAGVVAMLASAAGAFITGHNLVVDGGTTISDGN
ncbi:glucose 1-dehydrogenase [Comamonas testosteroni]|uniref:SDR family NAD(P)-dependent oxidoreductase n=1 Tax=Comamonas testosteroni TaxID=285 RepID=UPI0023AB189D|nr:glucose 1-dehydrogenase [Comamonas testosteroni]WEE79788.1 glucose 1-dehydrogenase [Comamonas testosteroni]